MLSARLFAIGEIDIALSRYDGLSCPKVPYVLRNRFREHPGFSLHFVAYDDYYSRWIRSRLETHRCDRSRMISRNRETWRFFVHRVFALKLQTTKGQQMRCVTVRQIICTVHVRITRRYFVIPQFVRLPRHTIRHSRWVFRGPQVLNIRGLCAYSDKWSVSSFLA